MAKKDGASVTREQLIKGLQEDLSREYQGRVRMTLTPPVVNVARGRVALITGADKARPVAAWWAGGASPDELPIARLRRSDTVVVLDPHAAAGLSSMGTG